MATTKREDTIFKIAVILFAIAIILTAIDGYARKNGWYKKEPKKEGPVATTSTEDETISDEKCDKDNHKYVLDESTNMVICRNCGDTVAFNKYKGLYFVGEELHYGVFGRKVYGWIYVEEESLYIETETESITESESIEETSSDD